MQLLKLCGLILKLQFQNVVLEYKIHIILASKIL